MRRFVVLVFCFVFLLSSMGSSFTVAKPQAEKKKAEREQTIEFVTANDERKVKVTMPAEVGDKISEEEIADIVNSNTDAESITINEVGYATPPIATTTPAKTPPTSKGNVHPAFTWLSLPMKSYTAYNVLESDRFMASCARGETKTIQRIIPVSLSGSHTGTAWGGLSLSPTISYPITEGLTLTGPPEGGAANSRVYRCKFYENRGNWSQIVGIADLYFYPSGTFKEPSKYIAYSIDINV